MAEQGIPAFVRAAREMADEAYQLADPSDSPRLLIAVRAFQALDHPDCPHGCIGGEVHERDEYLPDPGYIAFIRVQPCPIHGEGEG